MLKRGLYCLMNVCSVSRASASVATTSDSMWSTSSVSARDPYSVGLEKCDATRLRTDFALPT
jgi:hypothetical protein